jgi:hypothetical protein
MSRNGRGRGGRKSTGTHVQIFDGRTPYQGPFTTGGGLFQRLDAEKSFGDAPVYQGWTAPRQAPPATPVRATPRYGAAPAAPAARPAAPAGPSPFDLWAQQLAAQQAMYKQQMGALTAAEIGRIGRERRAAESALAEVRADSEAQSASAQAAFNLKRGDLARLAKRAGVNLEEKLGGKGLALSPAFMERGLVDIRDDQAAQEAAEQASMTDRLGALSRAVQSQQRSTESILAGLAEEEALMRSDPSRLIAGVSF